jgi:hypothetical protein
MNKFIKRNGEVVVVERFMQGPELDKGCWWWDISKDEDNFKTWNEQVQPPSCNTNINNLFGYSVDEFMAKQYK